MKSWNIFQDISRSWNILKYYFKISRFQDLEIRLQDFKISRNFKIIQDLKLVSWRSCSYKWWNSGDFKLEDFMLGFYKYFLILFLLDFCGIWGAPQRGWFYILSIPERSNWTTNGCSFWHRIIFASIVVLIVFWSFFRVFSEIRSLYAYIAGEPRMRIFHANLKSWNILK